MRRGYKRKSRRKRSVGVKVRKRIPRTVSESRDLSVRHDPKSQWMILEVNDDGEMLYERYDLLEYELLRIFGDETSFFIPSYIEKIKDKVVGIDLIGGYVFVEKTPFSEGAVVSMMSPYIKGRVTEKCQSDVITGADINSYKRKLLDSIKSLAPKKGAVVVPKVGTFKNMEGVVVSVSHDRKSAKVLFKRSSRIVQAPVSVLNMEPADSRK